MTTAIESQYTFTAEVKAKTKQQNRDGWVLAVDWKLPGSKYDLILYGQHWDTLRDIVIDDQGNGPTCTFTIQQGNIKADKTGQYTTDYFWDMVGIEIIGDGDNNPGTSSPVQAPPKPRPEPPTSPGQDGGAASEPPPNPAALGACHNHAVEFIIAGILPLPKHRELEGWIRELRDRFYREINQAPLAPLHYCYKDGQERKQSSRTGNWGHLLPKEADGDEDSYCIEGRERWRVFDASQ